MKFRLIIDKTKEEEVVATVHAPSQLTDRLEALIANPDKDRIVGYTDADMQLLAFTDIECITVLSGKTYAIDRQKRFFRLKQRLYELESILPPEFIRINKSSFANETHLQRFSTTFSGGVDAVFRCGYTEYVSRRCFAQIKRRFDGK